MSSIGQQTALVAAQQELLKLKGSGRQLLEAVTEAGNNSSRAQKVAAVIQSTERALSKADILTQQLGIGDGSFSNTGKSRSEALRRRKAELAGHEEPQQAPHLRRWDASDPAEMLQEVMQHVFAVTGYAVYGMGPDGNRVDASSASAVRLEIPRVMTAVAALAIAGQPEAVHVAAMSPAEAAAGRSHWKGSGHEVFRRVSDVAQHALQHFHEKSQQPMTEETQHAQHAGVLQSLLLWLASYRELFELPCTATGQLLAMDQLSQQLLPPVLRAFDVSPMELELIAGGSLTPVACHVHAL
ncbi:g4010 [Coccomyxa viridis]|uniref:G4010 protein n=1 Tax=Coccomyxa viridis TaxID=1274662 RepID=A0ABP1FWB3_9CHLO